MKKDVLKVVICDDESNILSDLENRVIEIAKKNSYKVNLSLIKQPEDMVKKIESENIDICLLDIDMPRISGMEIAKMINDRKLPIILIFVTGQDALVYESFRYHPFSFIRKSMLDSELYDTFVSAVKSLMEKETIIIKVGAEQIKLELSNVLYIEADGNYVKICTENEQIRYRATLSYMEEILQNKGFLRIHKGFLVNECRVFKIGNDELELSNKETLPIGRTNKEKVRQRLIESFRRNI